jgi:hypothetical protein
MWGILLEAEVKAARMCQANGRWGLVPVGAGACCGVLAPDAGGGLISACASQRVLRGRIAAELERHASVAGGAQVAREEVGMTTE